MTVADNTDEELPNNVVRAFGDLPINPIQIERRPMTPCSHEEIRLDEHSRTVVCERCDAVLDPFDFLLYNARVIQSAWTSHRAVKEQVRKLNESVSTLKREQKRLASSVRRLRDKNGEVLSLRREST